MTLSHPWGLLALFSIPAVVLIHLFQKRFRKRHITGLFLWHEGLRRSMPGRRVQHPPPTVSLFLEILACILLSLLLSGAGCDLQTEGKHLVFVLDSSASMSASPAEGETFKTRAEAKIREIIAGEGNPKVTLLKTGAAPSFIFGPEGDPDHIDTAFSKWHCFEYKHDILPSLTLARNIQGATGRTVVVSDHVPEEVPRRVTWIALGESLPNCAFTSAYRIQQETGRDLVRLSLKTYGDIKNARLTVREGDTAIFNKTIVPSEEPAVSFHVPSETKTLKAEIAPDAQPLDNCVLLSPPARKRIRFINLFKGKEKEILDRTLLSLPGTVPVEGPPADLYAGPGAAVLEAPDERWILAFAPYPDDVLSEDGASYIGPYTMDTLHPLFASVSLRGVAWHSPGIFKSGSFPLVSCGGRALVVEAFSKHSGFLFNLDLSKTNIFRTKTWPVLFYNLIDSVKATLPGPDRTICRAGESLTLQLPPFTSGTVVIEGDAWSYNTEYREDLFLTLPQRTMELKVKDEDDTRCRIAVNWLDAEESDLTGLSSGSIKREKKTNTKKSTASGWSNPLFQVLIWLLAAVFGANWWITRGGRRA